MSDSGGTTLRIGVALELRGDSGEMLADAKAIEAAGADSLWVDRSDDVDQYIVLAAIAAVTYRVRLVAGGAGGVTKESATCSRLANGRLVAPSELLVSTRRPEDAKPAFGRAREVGAPLECWLRAPFPDGRAAWDELRRACTDAGAHGVVLPNDPRLIDLLRNPDIIEARDDLKLSFG